MNGAPRTAPIASEASSFSVAECLSKPRCTVCGSPRLPSGVCADIYRWNTVSGCPDRDFDKRAEVTGVAAKPARDEEIDRLTCGLIFAARNLAASSVVENFRYDPSGNRHERASSCAECLITERGGKLAHLPSCKTGAVLGFIDQLCIVHSNNPTRKENAQETESTRAEAGTPARGEASEDAERLALLTEIARNLPIEALRRVASRELMLVSAEDKPALMEYIARATQVRDRREAEEVRTGARPFFPAEFEMREPAPDHGEPWQSREWPELAQTSLYDGAGCSIALTVDNGPVSGELLARIAACVNFCAGIPSKTLERQKPLTDLTRAVKEQIYAARILRCESEQPVGGVL